jgi:4-hydroxyproline epimerase
MKTLHILDSHTGGEPTRLVHAGGPELGRGPLAERLQRLRTEFDAWRAGVVNEPRGSEVMVGALLCEPHDATCTAGVIFFNNVGYLGMCGHGTIGLMVSLAHLKRLAPGAHRIETPVGVVDATLNADNSVTVRNVAAYRYRQAVSVEVPGHGTVTGDIAWGGNWFFLVGAHGQALQAQRVEALTAFTWDVRQALEANGITGADGAAIDHIELFGPAADPHLDSRNFVLCPGRAYDRSPCGTGTSAKLACLAADGVLAEGQIWRQESIIGSVFEGSYRRLDAQTIEPSITGHAYITAEGVQCFDDNDPFAWGIPACIAAS